MLCIVNSWQESNETDVGDFHQLSKHNMEEANAASTTNPDVSTKYSHRDTRTRLTCCVILLLNTKGKVNHYNNYRLVNFRGSEVTVQLHPRALLWWRSWPLTAHQTFQTTVIRCSALQQTGWHTQGGNAQVIQIWMKAESHLVHPTFLGHHQKWRFSQVHMFSTTTKVERLWEPTKKVISTQTDL